MFLSNGEVIDGVVADSLAETTPLYVGGNYYADSALQLAGQYAAYAQLYRKQLWVYVVVNKIGKSAARVPIRVFEKSPQGMIPADLTPYGRLLAKPNPKLDEYELWQWTASTFEVYGEAIWLKMRDDNGRVMELFPMHPANTYVNVGDDGQLWYMFTAGARHTSILPPIPQTDIVHFKGYNPDNTRRGMSMLEPLRLTLANEDAARRATFSWWQRGARPSVALVHPGTLSKDAANRLRANWESQHAGADRMGGTAVLEEGMKPEVIQLSAEEMQYIESRKLNREEVCAAADIPPPVVHILDQATYSNITEQMRSMYRDTMTPRFRLFESTLDVQLRPDFDKTDTLRAEFALDDVLRGDFETRVDSAVKLVGNGIAMPAEGREMLGLRALGGASDHLYANAAMVELGSAPRAVQTTAPTLRAASVTSRKRVRALHGALARTKTTKQAKERLGAAHTDAYRAVFARQRDAVEHAMNAKDSSVFDPAAWDQPMADELTPVALKAADVAGGNAAKSLGGQFNPAAIASGVAMKMLISAKRINLATSDQIDGALAADDPTAAVSQVFDTADTSRAAELGLSTVTALWGYAATQGATQAGGSQKTWIAGGNPRPEHAAVDGETVPIDETFSNGGMWPGDSDLGPDETCGCNCDLSYS